MMKSIILFNIVKNKILTILLRSLTLPGLGKSSRPPASNILMSLFIDLLNWSKISRLFLKFTWENFFKNFSLVISVSYCWLHHFLTNAILAKLKIFYILMQWSKWFTFWNIFLYSKIIISFLELFSATWFLCILQT